jgi:hypothetical protein
LLTTKRLIEHEYKNVVDFIAKYIESRQLLYTGIKMNTGKEADRKKRGE